MARSSTDLVRLARAVDDGVRRPLELVARHERVRVTLIAVAVLTALAIAVIPVREQVGPANIALVLVVVVGIVGSHAGPWPGVATAVWAAGLYTSLHAVPHGLPLVEDGQDALTAVLLVAAGVITGSMHGAMVRVRRLLQSAQHDVARLHGLAEIALEGASTEDLVATAGRAIRAELRLLDWEWERPPGPTPWPELEHNGLIAGAPGTTDPERLGELLAGGVALSLGGRGRFVLHGRPDTRVTPRQLKVAVILADFAATARTEPDGGQ